MQDIENEEINEKYEITIQSYISEAFVCSRLLTVFFSPRFPLVWCELHIWGTQTGQVFWWIRPLDNFVVCSCRQQDLYRILKAYTIYRPDEGYCQAQAPVAAVLLMHMPAEVRCWAIGVQVLTMWEIKWLHQCQFCNDYWTVWWLHKMEFVFE